MDVEEFKRLTRPANEGGSMIRKYTNGYEAHFIDRHPHGAFYRDPKNDLAAYTDEKIMLLNPLGVVVVFLKDKVALSEIEKSMKLQSV